MKNLCGRTWPWFLVKCFKISPNTVFYISDSCHRFLFFMSKDMSLCLWQPDSCYHFHTCHIQLLTLRSRIAGIILLQETDRAHRVAVYIGETDWRCVSAAHLLTATTPTSHTALCCWQSPLLPAASPRQHPQEDSCHVLEARMTQDEMADFRDARLNRKQGKEVTKRVRSQQCCVGRLFKIWRPH